MSFDRETRAFLPVEIRAADGAVDVEGYAAVFDQPADIAGLFVEVIHKGAFAQALRTKMDVPFLIEHAGLPLARTSSGTLDLVEDARGLHIASSLDPADPDVMRIVPKMKRGDLSKMSFAFRATRQEWDETTGQLPVRHVYEVELYDVAIVSTPAYGGTEIALRSAEAARILRASPAQRIPGFQTEAPTAALRGRLRMDMDLRVRRLRA